MAADVGRDLFRDRLSDLPDPILVSILSLIRLDEAARCTVLASRWRRIFSPTLLLDFNANMPARLDIIGTVESILAAHPTAPVRSFRAVLRYIPREKEDLPSGGWLQELGRRGVEELSLDFDFRDWHHKIPASLFDCSSLKRLRASFCTFPDVPKAAPSPALARLTEIELCCVAISDDSVNLLLLQCTELERLKMSVMSKLGRVHVRSPSLKVLDSDGNFSELFVEYAPNLESMYMQGGGGARGRGVCLKIAHAPKLKLLGYLGMSFHSIEIGETIFTEDYIDVKTLMPSLKTIAIEVSYTQQGYINWVIQLLNLFPCLEALYIVESDTWSVIQAAASESWDVLRHIPCIHNHLEKVVFEVYRGHEWQREMAKFLHGGSRFLKVMEFYCVGDDDGVPEDYGKPRSKEWVRKQQELLCLDSRASKDARFLFFSGQMACHHWDNCHNVWNDRIYDV